MNLALLENINIQQAVSAKGKCSLESRIINYLNDLTPIKC